MMQVARYIYLLPDVYRFASPKPGLLSRLMLVIDACLSRELIYRAV